MFRFTRVAAVLVLAGCGAVPDPGADCVAEGDGYDMKAMIPGPCCDGLTPANVTHEPDDAGVCQVVDIDSSKVCIACGDGTCGTSENACNCPEDCG